MLIGIGGFGHIGLQCLDAMIATTITAIDIKDDALDLAMDVGADHTVNSGTDDVPEAIDAVTDSDGATQVLDFVGADETTAYAPDIGAPGGDHHLIDYGGHVHEPAQALVIGEFDYRGTLVGQDTELQKLVALVERGDVDLRTTRYDLAEINKVAERLENPDIEGRAVITLP